jgi:hypothetical protein
MEEQYKMGNRDVKPNTLSYSSVITAWAKSRDPDAGLHGEGILRQMQTLWAAGNAYVQPNTITFNAAISAWGNGQDPQRVVRAQALFQEMRKMYGSGLRDVRPDVVTYNSLLQVLINSDDPLAAGEQADKYLQEMKNENIKPNPFVYMNMIKAWSKREDGNAKERIKVLNTYLKQLDQRRR